MFVALGHEARVEDRLGHLLPRFHVEHGLHRLLDVKV
jgi:hypothetical protein